MADNLMAALQSKLVAYESAGMDDLAKRVQSRITELQKAVKADAKATVEAKATTPKAKKAAPKKSALKSTKKKA